MIKKQGAKPDSQTSQTKEIVVEKATAQEDSDETVSEVAKEINGPKGLEPTRYGDWESKGRCHDF